MTRKTTAQRHLDAIAGGTVTRTNIIGIRKAINHVERLRAGWSGNRSNVTPEEADAIEAALAKREPAVLGELHDTGLKILRSRRWHRRFNDAQRAIIDAPHVLFSLVRFDRIGNKGTHAVPVYRASGFAGNFLFRNVSWQSAEYLGEESGPVVVEER